MKELLICTLLFSSLTSYCQYDGYYKGLEPIRSSQKNSFIRPKYHLNMLLIENDSVYLYKEPVISINKKDTIRSASVGAYYYYFGKIIPSENYLSIAFSLNNCDYCERQYKTDPISGFIYPLIDTITYKTTFTKDGILMNGVYYVKQNHNNFSIEKEQFFFDEKNIFRINPKNQYGLISQAINDFIKSNLIEEDSIIICTTRIGYDKKLVENFDPSLLTNQPIDKNFTYLNLKDIKEKVSKEQRSYKFLYINEITDYKNLANILITYKIMLPNKIKPFEDKECTYSFGYNKKENEYILMGKPLLIGSHLIRK